MKIVLAAISAVRSPRSDPAAALAADYLSRAARYISCESQTFASESSLLAAVEKLARQSTRTTPVLILFDSRGKQLTSEEFAAHIGRLRDTGTQTLILAIGPASGWSPEARARAGHILSFGQITLPHEFARAILAEQIYRALTILANHPYHSGH